MPHPVLRVSSSVRIPNPARRLGQIAPLPQRWAEAVARVHNELPADHPLQSGGNMMMSELALDDLLDALEAAKTALAAAPPNPLLTAAAREFYDLQRQFNGCAAEIRDAQGWLQRKASDWKHQLLRSLSADMFTVPVPLPTSIDERRVFTSIPAARRAAVEFVPKLQFVRGLVEQIKAARSFDNDPPEQQTMQLVRALLARLQESTARIINLESANTALTARLDRLERRKKPKLRRAAA
jgi:hypothetical protein